MNQTMSPNPPEAKHTLQPRHVKFDWQDTPLQWLPDDPFANHTINVLHLLFPAGEMWFCRVYNKALPLVTDPQVHADATGFMRQEAIHARSHEGVLKHYYAAHGIDTTPFTKKIDRLFSHYLGEKPFGLNIGKSRFWVRQQLGNMVNSLQQVIDATNAARTDSTLHVGLVPQRLPDLQWRASEFGDPGYAVSDVSGLTGQQRYANVRFDDEGRIFNIDPNVCKAHLTGAHIRFTSVHPAAK